MCSWCTKILVILGKTRGKYYLKITGIPALCDNGIRCKGENENKL